MPDVFSECRHGAYELHGAKAPRPLRYDMLMGSAMSVRVLRFVQGLALQGDGPSSSGKCKRCGTQRDFMNYFEGSSWGTDISLDQLGKSTGATREASYGQTVPTITEDDDA